MSEWSAAESGYFGRRVENRRKKERIGAEKNKT